MYELLAIPLGLLIGLSLGALGGGGSILTVPALVYLLDVTPKHATSASLVIVGITALTGTVSHARAGRVRWTPGILFGVVGIAGSLVGTALNRKVDPNVLLLAFAGLMLVAAVAMVQRQRQTAAACDAPAAPGTGPVLPDGLTVPDDPRSLFGPGLPTSGPTAEYRTAVLAHATTGTQTRVPATRRGMAVKTVLAGTVVGFMTGFFGVGGGFVVVPALVLALGFAMPEAVGTSLVVIAINSVVALAARAGASSFPWHVIVPFTVAAMVGSLGGNRFASKVPASTLVRGFATLLVVLAAYVATRSLIALS